MPRKVDVRWYETYLRAKHVFILQGREATLATVAEALEMKQKTLSRMLGAGRYLDQTRPNTTKDEVQCSYVHLETLERISRLSTTRALELLPDALANRVSIDDLKTESEALRNDSPLAARSLNARADKRRLVKSLMRDVEGFMRSNTSDYFGTHKGVIIKNDDHSAFQTPSFIVTTRRNKLHALVFCKVGADSKPPLAVAFDLYDLALARHAAPGKPRIWFVFPEHSAVMTLLAEIALWAGGTPFNGDWLFVANIRQSNEDIELDTWYQHHYAELLGRISAGGGSFRPNVFAWRGVGLQEADTAELPLFEAKIPEITGRLTYGQLLAETARSRLSKGKGTDEDMRLVIETDLGL